jgi:GT2 family glycosyltransferase
MKLSVVIGTYNRLAQLRQCLESIVAETRSAVRIYVTDAGSTDGTIDYLRSMASNALVPILVGERLGQARAYNEVFARLDTPYACWLSDDNVVVNRGLDVAARILDEASHIGMVALKVQDKIGPFIEAPYIGGLSSLGILNVNQGMLRTTVLRQLGGFSERFRDYGIDPDLTARVLFSGHAIAYTRPIAIHHYREWSNDPASAEYAQRREKQRVYQDLYQRKYGLCASTRINAQTKSLIWRIVKKALGVSLHSTRPVLGLLARDWHNMFNGQYISLLDPLRCWRKPYYLVQYCPPRWRPRELPSDPE